VYYLGDGEDTGGDRPLDFSDSATLIQGGSVLGYGTEAGGRMRAYDEYGRDYGDYIYDTRTYEDGISVIDEGNLDDIAQQLRVRYQHRDANADLEPATVDVARGVMSSDAANRMTFPIYWAFAAVAVAWLLFEAFVLTRSGRQLRDAIEDQDARDDARRAAEEARNG
jgi:Ca-activated chloride channel family protein